MMVFFALLVLLITTCGSASTTPWSASEGSENDENTYLGNPGRCADPDAAQEDVCQNLGEGIISRPGSRSLLQSQHSGYSVSELHNGQTVASDSKVDESNVGNIFRFVLKLAAGESAGNNKTAIGVPNISLHQQLPDESDESQVLEAKIIKCGDILHAPDGECPADCRFFASISETIPDSVCKFRCVAASDCGKASLDLDPNHHIADEDNFYCRTCKVPGCEKCVDGPYDKCAKCASGYYHHNDGHCYSAMWIAWLVIFSIVGIVAMFLLAWYLHLVYRPVVNKLGHDEGLNYRSKKKLHFFPAPVQVTHSFKPGEMGIDHDDSGLVLEVSADGPAHHMSIKKGDRLLEVNTESYSKEALDNAKKSGTGYEVTFQVSQEPRLWPLTTNLHDQLVAGPGLMLHFNFHFAVIAWACVCVASWIIFAYSTDPELLLLGLVSADSPHALCANTIHGKKAQKEMMWAKVCFVVLVYIGSFLGSIGYSIHHYRKYQSLDAETTSMRDFAALCTGLPRRNGSKNLEAKIKEFMENEIKNEMEKLDDADDDKGRNKVIGVSICWQYRDQADDVNDLLEEEIVKEYPKTQAKMPDMPKCFAAIDGIFGFGPELAASQEESEDETKSKGKDLVEGLTSSDSAFVVFSTEAARDAAVKASKDRALRFEDEDGVNTISLEEAPNEPDTVCWEIFSIQSTQIQGRSFVGIATVLGAVVVWCCCFYLPFAYYTASFSAAHNEEPGFLSGLTFSMLVVGGNQAMYFLCNEIAYRVGFRFADDAEAFYIALYTLACFLNLVVDLMLEFWLGYNAMVAAGVHTADGRLLGDLTSYQDIFESYPMQKALGRRLWEYCFPATFFIPFVFEPIFAIYVPYHIMRLLLRSYEGVRGREAQKSMEFFTPMDLARYGDLILNVMLTSLIFFFPAGQMLKLFLALIISHLFVYVYDKYRVLTSVPSFCFAGNTADECAQCILALPCAFLAACIVFKGNCLALSPFCFEGYWLAVACVMAFTLHVVGHMLILQYIVPKFWKPKEELAPSTYAETAKNTPCTWFSANPVHCLRSQHKFGDSPHCRHYQRGQEHLLRANKEIGCFFEVNHSDNMEEDYDL